MIQSKTQNTIMFQVYLKTEENKLVSSPVGKTKCKHKDINIFHTTLHQ